MASRNLRRSISIATKSTQLALAVPQVVAHRMNRMARAGANYSDRDIKEFYRMGTEKQAAFLASWNSMALQILRYQHALMFSWCKATWMSWVGARMTSVSMVTQWQSAAMATALSGLQPIHRTAVANARRLVLRKPR